MYIYTVRGDFKYRFEPNSDFVAHNMAEFGHSLSRSKSRLCEKIGPIWEMATLQHANAIYVTIVLRKVIPTLGISENGQQEKVPKSMAVKKSLIIAPNLQISL